MKEQMNVDALQKAIDKAIGLENRVNDLENQVANADAEPKQYTAKTENKQTVKDFKIKEWIDSGVKEYKTFTKGLPLDGNTALYEAELNTNVLEQAISNTAFLQALGARGSKNLDYRRTVLTQRPNVQLTKENTDFTAVVESDASNYASIPALYTKMYAYPWVTMESLEQSDVGVQANITKLLAEQFALTMQDQFLHGDGSNVGGIQQLRGMANAAIDRANGYVEAFKPAATRNRETFGAVQANAADIGTTPAEIEAFLYQLMLTVPQRSQANASFVMHPNTLSFLMQNLKDTQGRSLVDIELEKDYGVWVRRITLYGAQVILSEEMDEIGAGNCVILYGDLKAGYERITPEQGATHFTVDIWTLPDVTKFYQDMYIGSTVADHEAVAALVCV
ncbi:phage major capsid protein [Vibrio sp. D420a]|uniref:phage major capsid protein n=1 Tax=Vibrio sp. D420a TaxID=2836895 RepID=UPI002556B777|nr:phage major capsid protein [Vibrio sp. D420a]MDK9763960.1 phage major capsid protein [Vibrio sp. D420a]